MSVEALIEKIERKTAEEVGAILVNGEKRAADTRREIMSAAEKKADSIIKTAKENAELIMRAGNGEDEINLRIGVLNKKRELLDEIKAEAAKKLAATDASGYAKIITKYVLESGAVGNVSVTAGDSEKKKLLDKDACKSVFGFDGDFIGYWSEKLGAKFALSDKYCADGTLVLECENYDIDLSFGEIIDAAFEANEKKLAESLFGKGASL